MFNCCATIHNLFKFKLLTKIYNEFQTDILYDLKHQVFVYGQTIKQNNK
jgi:hypothetical protein